MNSHPLNGFFATLLTCWLAIQPTNTHAQNSSATFPELQPLTTTRQVLELGLEVARQIPHPVCVQGIITFIEPATGAIYLQDQTGGLRVMHTNRFPAQIGQSVTVQGSAVAGAIVPFIDGAEIRELEAPVSIEAIPADAARLAAGELCGQWVQLEGNVRDVSKEPDRALLLVSSGGVRFHATVHTFPGAELPVQWLEARVRLRGVCSTELDSENQPRGFTLLVPGAASVTVVRSVSTNFFETLPTLSSASPELRRPSDERVRVSGRVLFQSLGGNVFLEDSYGAMRARLLSPLAWGNPQARHVERVSPAPLRPGERIELVGSPAASVFAPMLTDGEIRRIAIAAPPEPNVATLDQIFSGRMDGRLISLRARLLAQEVRMAGAFRNQVLALQSGDTIFEAMREFTGTNAPLAIRDNSYVQVSGICAVQPGELNQVRTFRLLLRDNTDVRVLGRPPWWEGLPVEKILAGIIALVTVPVIWIWALRRQVSQRTAQLHEALAAERELNELRSRFVSMVSHEFRTPLGVILSAAENLNSYLDRLQPEQRRHQLDHIMQATRHMGNLMEEVLLLGRAEAGKLEFKPAPLDLGAFCERIAAQVTAATADRCRIAFHRESGPRVLADENLLRHILTNLLSNAVKYSPSGSTVNFKLQLNRDTALFEVSDRGIGIPPADRRQLFTAFHRGQNVGQIPGSGLGLVIAKRCADLHGGEIHCESPEGEGTRFTVRIPVTQASP
jgi:signal transduction histidine kinase